jgi:hypothetical protein
MDSEERAKLNQIHESVIRSEETMKWLKENCDIQRVCCEKHERRINQLEIHKGRIKGIFATITTAVIILAGIIVILISKIVK